MARRKTIEELLKEAEEGKSGRTLGEQRIKELEKVPESEKDREERKRKKKRGWFSGRRDKRTVLNA
jgi:hypothetical protein